MADKQAAAGLTPQKNGLYAIATDCINGIMTPSLLTALAEIAEWQGTIVHVRTNQQMMILGLDEKTGVQAIEKLEGAGGVVKKFRDIGVPRVCVGKPWCRFAAQDTFSFAETLYREMARQPVQPKFKWTVSGCPNSCHCITGRERC